MSNRIITIEREYASGGREVGELVAKQLGIPFYNREILEMASERCGVSVDYLASAEEAAPKSFLYTLMLSSNPTRSIQENLPLSDKVYIIETNIIKELAEKSDCVIVGRCASYILRDMEHMMSAFVYADQESRVNRAVSEYSVDPRRAEATLRKSDRRRETFYSINTGGNWYDKENYTLGRAVSIFSLNLLFHKRQVIFSFSVAAAAVFSLLPCWKKPLPTLFRKNSLGFA